MRRDVILFDLDGTLTDPAEGICGCIRYALEKDGRPAGPLSDYYPWIGPPLAYSFETFAGASPEDATRLVEYYRERFSTVGLFENKVYPGIPEMLRSLRRKGFRLAVATGKPTVFSRQILEHFGFLDCFESVSGSRMDERKAEKKNIIRRALAEMGVDDPCRCVMVGDRRHDGEGARMTGMDFIGVLYGYGSRPELEAEKPLAIAETVPELSGILHSL